MRNIIKVVALVAIVGLTACASAGVRVDPSQMAQFQKGRTTYDDVVTALGKPSQETVDDSGNRTVMYYYANSKTRPESFIPIVGAFVGGADTESTSATFNFNSHNVLTKMSQSQGGIGTNFGNSGHK